MKQQSFIKQFFVIGGSAFVSMLIGLLTTPLITRLVDPAQYGQVAMFNTYANIVLMIVLLGMDQAFLRYFYRNDSVDYQRKLLRSSWGIPCLIALVVSSVVYITFFNHHKRKILVLFIIYVFILLFNRFAILLLRLTKKSNTYSFMHILQKIAYVSIAIGGIWLINQNHFLILVCANILAFLIVTISSIYIERKIWNPFQVQENFKIPYLEMMKYGIPMMVANGIYMVFQAIDRISLSHYCSYTEIGVYSSAMSLLSVIEIIRSTFNTIWAPASVEHYEKNPNDKSFYERGNRYITFIMFFFGITLIFGKDILVLLLGEKYREASMILPFLLFHPIMYTISETTVVGIYFKKKSYASLIVSIASCITNLIGNILLIPWIGPKGAAISTGISYIVFFALRTAFSNHYYYVNYKLGRVIIIICATSIYALYNTFVRFNFYTVVFYVLMIMLLIILYRDTVVDLYKYSLKIISSKLKRFSK